MREEVLKTESEEINAIYSFDALAEVFSKEEREEFLKNRVKKSIKTRAIYVKSGEKLEPPELTKYRIIPENIFSITADVVIYGDNVAIMALKNKLLGVIIENEDIAQSMRSIFNLAWEAAEKYN